MKVTFESKGDFENAIKFLGKCTNMEQRSILEKDAKIGVEALRANIIDVGKESMIIELTGTKSKLEAFIDRLEGYEILELCRTGVTALERGGKHQHMQKPAQEVRDAQLPLPGTHCPQ